MNSTLQRLIRSQQLVRSQRLIQSPRQTRYRHFIRPLVLLFLFWSYWLFFNGCASLNYDVVPDETSFYQSLQIKINIQDKSSKEKQGLKILLKYQNNRDKLFFLSPVNQVYGLLLVENENALLINTKKKKYWQGRFNRLLLEMWDMDFDYREFKRLLIEGTIPMEKIRHQGIEINIEKQSPQQVNRQESQSSGQVNHTPPKSSGQVNHQNHQTSSQANQQDSQTSGQVNHQEPQAPEKIMIDTPHLLLKIKISRRQEGHGRLQFNHSLKGMRKTTIKELLE